MLVSAMLIHDDRAGPATGAKIVGVCNAASAMTSWPVRNLGTH